MRITLPTLRVLRALLDAPDHTGYGYDLMRATGIKSGSLYPILDRLQQEDLVTRETEKIDPAVEGRPARRYYQLTGDGVTYARQTLAEAHQAVAPGAGGRLRPATGRLW